MNGSLYLPVPSGMDQQTDDGKAEYHAFKERAQLYPVIDRTVDGIVGVAFLQNPDYNLPKAMTEKDMVESLTIDGESANTLAKLILDQDVSVGRFGILVDMASESTSDPRPYTSKYYAEHIWNWRRQIVNGKQVLVDVSIEDGYEKVGDRDGVRFLRLRLLDAGTENATYVIEEWIFDRELVFNSSEPVGFEAKFALKPPQVRIPQVMGKPMNFIPFIFINPKSLQPEIERPPMLDLVDICKGHYNNSANYENCLYAGAHDTFYIIGKLTDQEKPREMGGGMVWILPEGVTEVGVLSSSGQSMDSNLEGMQHKEDQMASMGARLIHQQQGEPETAEATRLNARQNSSVMVNVVDQAEAALNRIYQYAGLMMGMSPEDVKKNVKVTFNRDFIEARLTWAEVKTMMEVWQSGGIDEESYFTKAKGGGAFPDEIKYEEWKERLAAEEAEKDKGDGEEIDEEKTDEEASKEAGVSKALEQGSADHSHTVTLDENGNGVSSVDDSEAAGNHQHQVVNGSVQTSGSNNHSHSLDG